MMFWYGNHMSGWGYGLMTVGMVVFWGLVVFAIVALVRYLGRTVQSGQHGGVRPHLPSPEQVLADRFARGDIDAEDYQSRLRTLREHSGTT